MSEATTRDIQTNFTAGELSPLLEGRPDFDKYKNGLKTLENCLVFPHGGFTKRAGSHFVAGVKTNSKKVRLIPFVFDEDTAYVCEFGDLYVRFYTAQGRLEDPPGTPVEVVSPYLEADLPKIKFAQFGNAMYLAHPSYAIRQLTRVTTTSFSLKTAVFTAPPTFEDPIDLNAQITLSAVSGLGVVVTHPASLFYSTADVGRQIISDGGGIGVIQVITDATHLTMDVLQTFEGTTLAVGAWDLAGSPNSTLSAFTRARPVGAETAVASAVDTFRSDDVGKFVRANGGTIEIIKFTNAQNLVGVIRGELTSTTGPTGGAWTLEKSSWSAGFGFPAGIGLHEQRLWAGGTTKHSQTAWGTDTGNLARFNVGVLDTDSVEFTIAAKENNKISWLEGGEALLIGTIGGVFGVSAGVDKTISPSLINLKEVSSFGSEVAVSPVKVGKAVLYIQRPGLKLREIAFSEEAAAPDARDLTILSDHITAPNVVDMAYAKVPESVVWLVRSDGILLSFTYEKAHEVLSWARHITKRSGGNDQVESVTAIPGGSGKPDEVWIAVKRTIGGTKRYIEFLDRTSNAALWYGKPQLDSCLTYNGAPATVFGGLTHLEGESVYAIGDGVSSGPYTVSSGSVTISPAASKCEIGLLFVPVGVTMRPDIPVNTKTGQGVKTRWARVRLRLKDTGEGVTINDDSVSDQLADAPTLFTGDVEVMNLGSEESEGRVTISQTKPLPLTVLMLTGVLDLGN